MRSYYNLPKKIQTLSRLLGIKTQSEDLGRKQTGNETDNQPRLLNGRTLTATLTLLEEEPEEDPPPPGDTEAIIKHNYYLKRLCNLITKPTILNHHSVP